jgi:hypothetical protein
MRLLREFAGGLLLLCSLAVSAQPIPGADPVGPRGDFSGTWYNPAQSGHGLFVEVLDRGQAAVAWFTFDPAGAPIWLYGLVEVRQPGLVGTLMTVSGGQFPPAFDPAQVSQAPWGEIEFRVLGCDAAELHWSALDPAYGSGTLALGRLTELQGQRCNVEEQFGEQRIFSFERGTQGFEVVFADLPAQGQDIYELDFAWEPLPEPLETRRGLRLSGHNRSDDLAMLIKAPIAGLVPLARYRVEFELELASNVPTGCVGIGGSPGDSVYIKLGAAAVEPLALSQDEGGTVMKRLNIDYGIQSQPGEHARVVGTLANGFDCDASSTAPWQLKSLDSRPRVLDSQLQPMAVRADADGMLWVFAGTDSAFEGKTDVYFTALRVRLERLPEP